MALNFHVFLVMDKKHIFIRDELYKEIVKSVPISCVDVIIQYKGKFLLGRRTREPGKGQWFFPGGRIIKGEKLEEAAKRKIMEELGARVKVKDLKFLTTKETIFKKGSLGSAVHTINSVFILKLNKIFQINNDYQHSEFKWFHKINKSWHFYIRDSLRSAGFK